VRELNNRTWTDQQLTTLRQAQANIDLAISHLPKIQNWSDAERLIRTPEHLRTVAQIQLKSVTQLTEQAASIQSVKALDWVCIYEPELRSDAEDKDSYCAWFSHQCREVGVKVVKRLEELSLEQRESDGIALIISPRFDSLDIPTMRSKVTHVVTRLPAKANASNSDYKYAIYEESEAAQRALWEVLFFQHPVTGQLPIEQN
jgi:hypothetical protein